MTTVFEKPVSQPNTRSFAAHLIPIAVFLFFATAFLMLRSRQYLAVDGAVRALGVYRGQGVFFDGNNHLLYPLNVLLWSNALELIGFHAETPFDFIALTQAMNSIAAAGCLAMMYILVRIATCSIYVSLAATCAYGSSRAFLLHATNSAEPVVGLLWSILALLIVVEALRHRRKWMLLAGGLCIALALASYQSMVLLAPLAGLLCVGWPVDNEDSLWKKRFSRLAIMCSGVLLGVCSVYGWAYRASGVTNLPSMIERFFRLDGGSVYGFLSLSKIVNGPFGLISAMLPALPPDYAGIRSVLREPQRLLWISCIFFVIVALSRISWLLIAPVKQTWYRIAPPQRQLIVALGTTLLVLLGPLVYWTPLYDKLWLQPLGVIIALMAVLYRIGSPSLRRSGTVVLLSGSIVLQGVVNVLWAIPAHQNPTKGMKESLVVADVVKPNDFIVLSFDKISTLYLAFWGSAQNSLMLPAAKPEPASIRLTQAIEDTRTKGGHVYFLSLFDMPEPSWTAFLGNRVGISYHSFDRYRSQSTVVRSFLLDGQRTTLRVLTPHCC